MDASESLDAGEPAGARARWDSRYGEGGDRYLTLMGLMRAHQLTVVRVDTAMKAIGLTRNAFLVLITLRTAVEGMRSLGRLGKALMVHPTTITTVIDQLERADLVERRPHPADRRTILARLTDAGRAKADQAADALKTIRFGFEGVDAATLRELSRAAHGLIAELDDERPIPGGMT